MIIHDSLGHMVSTDNPEELHSFAKLLGLKRAWYQTPGPGEKNSHYDLTTWHMRLKAADMGSAFVHPRHLVTRAWWSPVLPK